MGIKYYDPFRMMIFAAKEVYPALSCIIQFDPELACPPYGETISFGKKLIISIAHKVSVMDALEILAHELAHVSVGIKEGHNKVWEEAMHKIIAVYQNNILNQKALYNTYSGKDK